MEILKLKSIMTKVKILLERSNGRFELTKERISDLENKSIEIMKSEEKGIKKFKNEQRPRDSWDIIKYICL